MADFYSKANECHVDEQFDEAIKLYTQAIEVDGENAEFYLKRSQTHAKLEDYIAAERDARKSIELKPNNYKGHLRLGEALFKIKNYVDSLKAFREAASIEPNDKHVATWLNKCEPLVPKDVVTGPSNDAVNAETELDANDSTPAIVEPVIQEIPMLPIEKQRYDWYQTETHVVINILIKKVNQEDVEVNYSEQSVSATVKQASGTDYSLELDLEHAIVPAKSITKILNSKVELKMKKLEGLRWSSLQGDGTIQKQEDTVKHYPTSNQKMSRNWDKMVKDFEKEEGEPEGEAAVNSLFQKIYADGSDEVRRAMNKSYSESGGTVLSTNWSEIGKKKTDVKPPDGMEYKNY